ncbi:MAG TPA: organomercurial lyase [Nitrolancea sp.]|nr:organomercurial lyase [Nitrolancea sp.]
MANPLSAVPTPYMVRVNGRTLYANCAWDALGIPAMLAADALVEAQTDPRGEPVSYSIEGGELRADDRLIVHFPLPFRVWYDDLVHT